MNLARMVGVGAGVVVSALSVAMVAALATGTLPQLTREPVSLTAHPPAATSVLACAGPVLAVGRDLTQAGALSDAAQVQVTAAAGQAPFDQVVLGAPDVPGGAGALALLAPPVGDDAADVAAAESARVDADDLSGFAASGCGRAQMESWLIGASAATGAADLVLLTNPGDVPALVSLSVYGAQGLTTPAAGKDIVVAARSQRVLTVAALALGEDDPVIRVASSQAPVRASLQTSLTRVLVPGGVDQVSAAPTPDPTLVIPGVPVTVAPGDPGASNVSTSLRLLAPTADGTATVTVRTAAGESGQPEVVPLVAGVPLRLELAGLAVGTYSVTVAATTPVTGAVWAASGFGAGSDFGWFTGTSPLGGSARVAVAESFEGGPSPTLTLVSTATADQAVTLTGADGVRQVVVPAGGTATVPVAAGTVSEIAPEGPGIHAAVTFAAPGAIAGYPVEPGVEAASAILVYPR